MDLSTIFANEEKIKLEVLPIYKFINHIIDQLNNNPYNEPVLKFLLHQGWLDGCNVENQTNIELLQNRTKHILKQLQFEWQPIAGTMFSQLNAFKVKIDRKIK